MRLSVLCRCVSVTVLFELVRLLGIPRAPGAPSSVHRCTWTPGVGLRVFALNVLRGGSKEGPNSSFPPAPQSADGAPSYLLPSRHDASRKSWHVEDVSLLHPWVWGALVTDSDAEGHRCS